MRILLYFLMLSACPLSLLTNTPPPEIVSLTGEEQVQMSHVPFGAFTWQIRHATTVSVESGAIENGIFIPGGWYYEDHLPSNGSTGFPIKIGNYAIQLCAENLYSAPVCAICNPFEPEMCGQ